VDTFGDSCEVLLLIMKLVPRAYFFQVVSVVLTQSSCTVASLFHFPSVYVGTAAVPLRRPEL
jgi:hypothetical protein